MLNNIYVESISDSSDSEQESSLEVSSQLLHPEAEKAGKVVDSELRIGASGIKKENTECELIDIASFDDSNSDLDSDSDSDSDYSNASSLKTVNSDADAISQLLMARPRHPKPQHPNLISRSSQPTSIPSLPPRHPAVEIRKQGIDSSTNRHAPPVSHQSVQNEKALFLWRRRLWPSLATFYRIILRCNCKYTPTCLSSDSKLTSTSLNEVKNFQEMLMGNMSLEWGSFWDPSALAKLSVNFSSITEHNRQMFLLLLEESRSSMCTEISKQPQGYLSSGMNANKNSQMNIKWQRGEVKKINSNLRESLSSLYKSSTSNKVDPRLGNLWILELNILPPKRSRSDSDISAASSMSNSNKNLQNEKLLQNENDVVEGYRPGDLLVCRNQAWGNRLALGVVQGYDPDYDMLLNSTCDDFQSTTINLLVCVETETSTACTSSMSTEREPSGWVDPHAMHLCPGSLLQLTPIGNLVTSLRECQAISSLASLRPSLRQLLLCSLNKKVSNVVVPVEQENSHVGSLKCPHGVSSPLWFALSGRYNRSQLNAIASVIEEPRRTSNIAHAHSMNRKDQKTSDEEAQSSLPYPLILLQGPPGTGKTSTILGMLAVLLDAGVPSDILKQQGKKIRIGSSLTAPNIKKKDNSGPFEMLTPEKCRILICAPSNTAVDELVCRIKRHGVIGSDGLVKRNVNVVRIGQPLQFTRGNVSTDTGFFEVRDVTLDFLVDKKRRDIEATQRNGYRRPFVPNTVQLRHQVLEQADIVCCTLSGSGSPQLLEAMLNHGSSDDSSGLVGRGTDAMKSSIGDSSKNFAPFRFDVVIIDEAAQCVEPSALIPLKYNPKVLIMVGDPCQLRATVISKEATKFNYGRSLFERLDAAGCRKQMLLTQYRMHPDIARFSSYSFYGGRLTNDPKMQQTKKYCGSHWKSFHTDRSKRFRPMVFHDVAYGHEELLGSSYSNRAEGEYILDLFKILRKQYPSSCSGGIGIIAAYKAQTNLLKQLFKQHFGQRLKINSKSDGDVEISTVDGFQGREKDIVIFSCVRTSSLLQDRADIGFMKDKQRLNVALTRAKYGMWIVGDMRTMAASGSHKIGIWGDLVAYCRRKGFVYEVRR